jgi:putative endonuclease
MYYVYVLYSTEHGRTHVEYARDPATRIAFYNESSTPERRWSLLHVERFETKKYAMLRERELKSNKGQEWIKALVNQKYHLFERTEDG